MEFQNIKEQIKNIKFFSTEDTSQLPNVKKLLTERYFFTLSKNTKKQLGKTKLEKNSSNEYIENWDLLVKRVARRISVGILGLIDEKNSEYIEDTDYISKIKNDEDFLLHEIRNMESDFYHAIKEKLFIPSSPFLFNAGRAFIDTEEQILLYLEEISLDDYRTIYNKIDPAYGSCYSMGTIKDDIKDIFDNLYKQAEIFRNAGGFGINFSKLRSKHAMVKTIKGNSSGPLSFMKPFNNNTELIALSSSLKRGMFIYNCAT